MKENKKKVALNKRLPEFYLESLEQRLETAPITSGGLLSIEEGSDEEEDCFIGCDCNCNNKCDSQCSCDELCPCDLDCECNIDCHDLCAAHI